MSSYDCPKCRADTAVRDSRPHKLGLRRRRQCAGCGLRFTTYENAGFDLDALDPGIRQAVSAQLNELLLRLPKMGADDRIMVMGLARRLSDATVETNAQ